MEKQFFNIDIRDLVLIIVAFWNSLLGILLLLKNRKEKINIFFATTSLTAAGWAFGLAMFRETTDINFALFWAKFYYIAATLIGASLLSFSFVFPFKKTQPSFLLKILFLLFTIFVLFISVWPNVMVKQVLINSWGKGVELGWVYNIYTIYFVMCMIGAFGNFISKYQIAKGIQKLQIQYVFLGTILAVIWGTIFNLFLPLVGNYKLIWAGPYFTLIMIGFLTYSILKHHLMNVKVIATEILVAILASILLLEIFLEKEPILITFRAAIFCTMSIIGFLLIKSVLQEVHAKEEIQILAKDLEAANTELKKLDKAKSEFLSIASHQLRTPLTAIKGYSSMILEKEFGKFSEGVKEATEKIFESSQQLVLMIDDFLDISKIEAGKMSYEFSTFNLEDLVKKMVKGLLDNNKKARELDLKYITNSQNFPIRGDINKISQVVSNLMDNSIKYTPAGYIKVYLDKNQKGDMAILTVKDTGIGISKETMAKLFQKFSRSEKSSLFNTSGSGLGLYVAKRIVTDHKGRIWAESDGLSKGSSFFVELPLV